ncbi:hypothetical protein EVAR_20440_1 [Eumeta japonica]|uniref:Uncharacterized protein n=1 Tax=Eumeta variegata TaxID=151549 RepID=A0A4C1TYB2_EUMVA|nr:hypothetical protein EVAR_20440_1 [Eumeta japonica]
MLFNCTVYAAKYTGDFDTQFRFEKFGTILEHNTGDRPEEQNCSCLQAVEKNSVSAPSRCSPATRDIYIPTCLIKSSGLVTGAVDRRCLSRGVEVSCGRGTNIIRVKIESDYSSPPPTRNLVVSRVSGSRLEMLAGAFSIGARTRLGASVLDRRLPFS